MEEQDKPSFFTIIKEGRNTNTMKVPEKMLKYVVGGELWSNGINLIGPSGEQWEVSSTMKKLGGNGEVIDIYLEKGWPKFLKDNSVKNNEFLLFTHISGGTATATAGGENNKFQVQIFGDNGCERVCFQKDKEVEEEAATPKKKRGRPAKKKRGRPPKKHSSN